MDVRNAFPVIVIALACGLSSCGDSDGKTDSGATPSSTTSQSPTSSTTPSSTPSPPASSEAPSGGTFTTTKIPCDKLTAPEGYRFDKQMANSANTPLCPYVSDTGTVSVSFRPDGMDGVQPLLDQHGEVEVPGWTHGMQPKLDGDNTGFYRFLVGSDGTVLQCSVTAGAQGTPVDASSHADFCDAAKALVYTE